MLHPNIGKTGVFSQETDKACGNQRMAVEMTKEIVLRQEGSAGK
jgi:hypothetical protein